MAREFKTGYKITGDSSGGVRAAKATDSELKKLNTTIEKQGKLGSSTTASIGKYTAGIAAAATMAAGAVFGIGRFVSAVADQGDRVQKLSIQLGTSSEFLSGMGHAAELSGSSLEGLSKGMAKMERSVADLGDGLSTQVTAFGRLGIAYGDLKDLSPEDQFMRTASAIGAMEDKSLRTATAMQIFGRSGVELIPLFAAGEEGLLAMREEAERLGLVMSQDFVDASAQFNDELTRSQGVVTGIKRQIAEGLMPALTSLMQQFVDSAEATDIWEQVGEFLGNVVRVLVAGFVTLKTIVELAATAIWTAGKVIVETLVAITAPIIEFGSTLSTAFNALIAGDFAGAADAFSGLGTRMKDAFVDNINAVGLTLKEFGQDSAGTITKAVGTVNDILTKNATISQGAAAGMETFADQTSNAGKEADKAAKAFQTLIDRLDPLTKMQRTFTVEQALLNSKIAEGGDDVLYYEGLLMKLQAEYARSKAEATGWGQAAEDAGQKAIDAADKATSASEKAAAAAQKEADDRAKALAQQATDLETFETAFKRGIERMDDLGAELWKGWITGAKSAMDSIKSFFQNWLAEMAHAAITRPIMVSITAAMGLGTAASAAAGVPGATGVMGSAGTASSLSGLGSLASLFTGNGIGSAFTSLGGALPTWLGGTAGTGLMGPTAAGGNIAGGIFANAGGVANWQFGLAGILGGIVGDKLFGGAGGIGGSIGAAIGTAILPGIGTIIGGLLGGAIGGLFGKDRPAVLDISGTSHANESRSDDDNFFESALGGVYTRSRRIDDATVKEFGQKIADFDNLLAGFMDADQLAEATGRLKTWELQLEGNAITLEDYLGGRFAIILGTFTQDMQDFVGEVAGLEGQVERLALASTAQRLIDAAPELFEGRTFRDFIAVAEAMQAEGEALTDTFSRLFTAVVQISQALEVVRGFASSDIAADFDRLMAQQQLTLKDVVNQFGDQIHALRDGFTGSVTDLETLTGLVANRYTAEIAYLGQIQQVADVLKNTFTGLKEQINRDLFGDEAFYDQVTAQAEQLAADLRSMTDPAVIASTVAEIQRLTGIAYGLLDEEGKQASGQGFLDFIEGVESDAGDALQLARDLFIEESDVLRNLVTEMADEFADPLAIAATAHEDAAKSLSSAGMSLSGAAGALGSVAGQLVGAVRSGIHGLSGDLAILAAANNPPGSTTVPGGSATTPATGSAAQSATLIATTVANAVIQAGNTAANTIQSSVGGIRVEIIQPGRGLANN